MGKGDIRSRRGKIINKSFGKSRPKTKNQYTPPKEVKEAAAKEAEAEVVAEETKK